MRYKILRADRSSSPRHLAGSIVHSMGDHYGCADDDTRAFGIEHICVCEEPGGYFFTIPAEDVEPVRESPT